MGLRQISRTAEEQNALIRRFGIAQDATTGKPEEEEDYGTIEQKLKTRRDFREAVYKAAMILDRDVEPGPASAQALIHLEAALMWGGKEVFS